jgi:hypothetical protein
MKSRSSLWFIFQRRRPLAFTLVTLIWKNFNRTEMFWLSKQDKQKTARIGTAQHAIGWHFFRNFNCSTLKNETAQIRLILYLTSFSFWEQKNDCLNHICSNFNCWNHNCLTCEVYMVGTLAAKTCAAVKSWTCATVKLWTCEAVRLGKVK